MGWANLNPNAAFIIALHHSSCRDPRAGNDAHTYKERESRATALLERGVEDVIYEVG